MCDNEQLFSGTKKDVMNYKDLAGCYFSCRFSSKSRQYKDKKHGNETFHQQ